VAAANVKGTARVTVMGEPGKLYVVRTLVGGKASYVSVPANASGNVVFTMPTGTTVKVYELNKDLSFDADGVLALENWL